jgi:hypothetical protein
MSNQQLKEEIKHTNYYIKLTHKLEKDLHLLQDKYKRAIEVLDTISYWYNKDGQVDKSWYEEAEKLVKEYKGEKDNE